VVPDKGIFHCFGCGANGDVLDFVRRISGSSFPEAVEEVASIAGVLLGDDEERAPQRAQRAQLRQVMDAVQSWFTSNLGGAAKYLQHRGYTREQAQEWGIGFAPPGWDSLTNHLKRTYIPLETAVSAGVLIQNEQGRIYDRFRDRLMFPIKDSMGRVIAFAGRDLTGNQDGKTPKYINSPETALYHKGSTLYGIDKALDHIRSSKQVILTEGYTDVHAMRLAGHGETVAVCGTALTEAHAKKLGRLAGRVLLAGDPDSAGVKAMLKHLPALLAEAVEVYQVPLTLDPADELRENGEAALSRAVEAAEPFLPVALRLLSADYPPSPSGRSQAAQAVLPILHACTGVHQQEVIRLAAGILGVQQHALAGQVRRRSDKPVARPIHVKLLDPVSSNLCWLAIHLEEGSTRDRLFEESDPEWFEPELNFFMAKLYEGGSFARALAKVPEAFHAQLTQLAADKARFGRGTVGDVVSEVLTRGELRFVQTKLGQAHNGVRFGLQTRALELREKLLILP